MSIEVERATVPCGVCGANVAELRRGRCWGCYVRWTEVRPVGRGAACLVCDERRRDQLRLVELHNRSVPLCHGCAARSVKMIPMPETVDELRDALNRERRAEDRRDDGIDRRVFPRERRVGEKRRAPRQGHAAAENSADMASPNFDDIVIEIQESDLEIIETTNVREQPTQSDPTASSSSR